MKIGKFNNEYKYKGYVGSIEFSSDDNCYFGKIYNINDLVLYEAETVDDLYEEFKKAVDDYIEFKKEINNENGFM